MPAFLNARDQLYVPDRLGASQLYGILSPPYPAMALRSSDDTAAGEGQGVMIS